MLYCGRYGGGYAGLMWYGSMYCEGYVGLMWYGSRYSEGCVASMLSLTVNFKVMCDWLVGLE